MDIYDTIGDRCVSSQDLLDQLGWLLWPRWNQPKIPPKKPWRSPTCLFVLNNDVTMLFLFPFNLQHTHPLSSTQPSQHCCHLHLPRLQVSNPLAGPNSFQVLGDFEVIKSEMSWPAYAILSFLQVSKSQWLISWRSLQDDSLKIAVQIRMFERYSRMSSTLPCWFFQQPQSQDEPHPKDDKIQRPQAIQVVICCWRWRIFGVSRYQLCRLETTCMFRSCSYIYIDGKMQLQSGWRAHLDHSFLDLSILVFLRLAAPEVCTSLTAVFNSLRLKGGGTDTFPDGTEPPQRETARFTKLPRLSPQISWSFSIF